MTDTVPADRAPSSHATRRHSRATRPATGDQAGYDDRLANSDLVPLKKQSWSSYNIFAFWMSDVHSVGGYVTAGSAVLPGHRQLAGADLPDGRHRDRDVFCNLVAKPSQVTGVPYPVINRAIFGVRGANIPAIIRGCIAIAWYGVQTYLAATSLMIIFLKFFPSWSAGLRPTFLGLSPLGYICYAILWVAQAAVFWRGMEAIRRFIDWAGPAVYVVMIVLCVYLVAKAGISQHQPEPGTSQRADGGPVDPAP